MSILSDATLRTAIGRGELITGGDVAQVQHCAYHFTVERIFEPGPDGASLDWTTPATTANYVVKPGAMIWFRTRGIVTMPADMSAFYWQTNTLSRQGLMLVNASMVEPGYSGPLACLFANFGRDPVVVFRTTVVAKLIFFKLDQASDKPLVFTSTTEQYDEALKKVALQGPESFLRVSAMTRKLDDDLKKAIKAVEEEQGRAVVDFQTAAKAAKTEQLESLTKDFNSKIRSALGFAGVGLLIVLALINGFAFIQSRVRSNIESEIE